MKIPAITLHQPWATLMAIGAKKNETRDWPTEYRGPIAIHAGKSLDGMPYCIESPFRERLKAAGYTQASLLPLGAIVGMVTVIDCVSTNFLDLGTLDQDEDAFGNYGPDRFAWITQDAMRVDPIQARGYQKIWEWADPPASFAAMFENAKRAS